MPTTTPRRHRRFTHSLFFSSDRNLHFGIEARAPDKKYNCDYEIETLLVNVLSLSHMHAKVFNCAVLSSENENLANGSANFAEERLCERVMYMGRRFNRIMQQEK